MVKHLILAMPVPYRLLLLSFRYSILNNIVVIFK
jgi:hypothetical protein